jgi:hypothetical protein
MFVQHRFSLEARSGGPVPLIPNPDSDTFAANVCDHDLGHFRESGGDGRVTEDCFADCRHREVASFGNAQLLAVEIAALFELRDCDEGGVVATLRGDGRCGAKA